MDYNMEANVKMKVKITHGEILCERYGKKKFPTFREIEKEKEYINELITDADIDEWCRVKLYRMRPQFRYPKPRVLISAPTGSGKNYFVIHRLFDYAKRNGKTILYVGNRIALGRQQKQELAKRMNNDTGLGHEDVVNREQFEHVAVKSYQNLASEMTQNPAWIKSFDFVVFDECHFFYSDALFNSNTGYIL
jgi:DNA or RNA helicases of superfamily II